MKNKLSDDELLNKLVKGDDTALACLYEAYANRLLNFFKSRSDFFTIDEHVIQDVICDSLCAFADNPARYDKSKARLITYLVRDVRGNLLNDMDKQRREKKKRESVAHSFEARNNIESMNGIQLEPQKIDSISRKIDKFFKEVFDNEQDERMAWQFVIEGTRETRVYSKILGLEHLSFTAQKAEVKKHKDRIRVRLNRKGWPDLIKELKRHARE